MEKRFQNKVAIVTGGNSGIGKVVAIGFAREGANVVIAARRAEEGEAVVKTIRDAGGEAIFVPTDVSDAKSVQALVNTTIEQYKRLDIAFNNAGVVPVGARLIDLTEEEFDRDIDINLKGCFLCIKAHALDAIPMNRSASPEEVVGIVHLLCSDEASFITGQNFVVDGGQTLMGGGVTATKIREKYK